MSRSFLIGPFTFMRVWLFAFTANSKFFSPFRARGRSYSECWSISSMSARSTPNCTSQIGHRAKRCYFFVFLFRPRAVRAGKERKRERGSERVRGGEWALPGIIEKSRVSRREHGNPVERHWFPIFPQRDTSIGRTQSSRLIKQHANSANSYILKRARR